VVAGVILALLYRDQGPEPERTWLDDEELDELDELDELNEEQKEDFTNQ